MGYFFVLPLLLLIPNVAYADDCFRNAVTLKDPATYRITYTGIYGAVMDEYVSFMSRKWLDDIDDRFDSVDIFTQIKLLRYYRTYYTSSIWSDNRKYWWHYLKPQMVYNKGPTGDLIDIGPIRVTSKFRVKIKEYDVDLTKRWSVKVKPRVKFTSSLPVIRSLSMSVWFTYKVRKTELVRFVVATGVNVRHRAGFIEVLVVLPSW